MEKIKRDAFLYLSPQSPKGHFAQCGTCLLYNDLRSRCTILGGVHITPDMSCGLYIHGDPSGQRIHNVYTKEEVGLVDRQVRCENCTWSNGNGVCLLYRKLNETLPETFSLDEKIEAQGCCNAQTSKELSRFDQALRAMNGILDRLRR